MAVVMANLYQALIECRVSAETAERAAGEIASQQLRRLTRGRAERTVLKLLLGGLVGGVALLVVRAFFL